MNPVPIVIAIPSLLLGGAERFAVQLAMNLDRERFAPTVMVTRGQGDTELARKLTENGVNIIDTSSRSWLGCVVKVTIEIVRLRPAVVHTNLSSLLHVAAGLALTRSVRVRIHTMHSMAGYGEPGFRRLLFHFVLHALKFTPVAVSDAVMTSTVGVYEFSEDAIPIIYNGVNLEDFTPRPRIAALDQVTRFIAVGNLVSVKNHLLMLRAFAAVKRAATVPVSLCIVGDGPLYEGLREEMSRLGIAKDVELAGRQTDVASLLRQSDVFVSSSDVEGLPLALLEGMACGLPVAATAAGGVVDVVRPEIDGFVVRPGDVEALRGAMLELTNDPELRIKMGAAARLRAEEFSLHACVRRYERLYEQR